MRDPENLGNEDERRLGAVLGRRPELEATRRHIGAFARMIRDLIGEQLSDWMDRVGKDNLPALHSFITGLRKDLTAVTAGLTVPWNNGPAESAVNRIKMLKRQCSSRANLAGGHSSVRSCRSSTAQLYRPTPQDP